MFDIHSHPGYNREGTIKSYIIPEMKNAIKYLIILSLFVSCGTGKDGGEECIDVIKRDVDSSNCFIDGYDKFVSLFFSKIGEKTVVEMVTVVGYPYQYNTVCYYKHVEPYVYVCSGFCDEFKEKNGFSVWNDSVRSQHHSFQESFLSQDTMYKLFRERIKDTILTGRYYEYQEGELIRINSISEEEKYIIDIQSDSFDTGFLIGDLEPEKETLEEYERLKDRIRETGDKEAYDKFILTHYGYEMLPYAMIMAEKYKLPSAYDDAYYAMLDLYEHNDIKMDTTTWSQALHFLEKGAELNDLKCIMTLHEIYRFGNKYTMPDTTRYRYYERLENKGAVLKRE